MKADALLREGYKLYLSENNPASDIIVLIFFWNEKDETDNARTAELIEDDFRKILRMDPDKSFRAIVDLVQFGDSATEVLTPQTKEIYARLISQEQLKKVAIIGSSTHIQGLALGVMNIFSNFNSDNAKIKWFTDIRKARDWLNDVA